MTEHSKIFLDTNPIIYLIEGNKDFYDKVEGFFIDNKGADYITSTATIAEYFPHPIREGRQDYITAFNTFIEKMDIEVSDIDRDIAYKAAEIRASYTHFKPMDALQLASAVVSGCDVFLTNDKQLKQFMGLQILLVSEL